MNKTIFLLLSIFFLSQSFAEQVLIRNARCIENGKSFSLLSQSPIGLKPGIEYIVFERDLAAPEKMPRTVSGSFSEGGKLLSFPKYWRPQAISLTSCHAEDLHRFRPLSEEIIRDFYVKTYFIAGDLIDEDIEELVRRGDAIPLKVRILCTSREVTDDVTLCTKVRILDEIIPIERP